jgi:hypothetical protein
MKKIIFLALGLIVTFITATQAQDLSATPNSNGSSNSPFNTKKYKAFLPGSSVEFSSLSENSNILAFVSSNPGVLHVLIFQSMEHKELATFNGETPLDLFFVGNEHVLVSLRNIDGTFSLRIYNINSGSYIETETPQAFTPLICTNENTLEGYIQIGDEYLYDRITWTNKSFGELQNVSKINSEPLYWFKTNKQTRAVALGNALGIFIYEFHDGKIGKEITSLPANSNFIGGGIGEDGKTIYFTANTLESSFRLYKCDGTTVGHTTCTNPDLSEAGPFKLLLNTYNEPCMYVTDEATTELNVLNCRNQSALKQILYSTPGEKIESLLNSQENNIIAVISSNPFGQRRLTVQCSSGLFSFPSNSEKPPYNFVKGKHFEVQTDVDMVNSGTIYCENKTKEVAYPVVIVMDNTPFTSEVFTSSSPLIQYLAANGYAVVVWNTRYAYYTKAPKSYPDLKIQLTLDLQKVLTYLLSEYNLNLDELLIYAEGEAALQAIHASFTKGVKQLTLVNPIIPELSNSAQSNNGLLIRKFIGDDYSDKTFVDAYRLNYSKSTNIVEYSVQQSGAASRLKSSVDQSNGKYTFNQTFTNLSSDLTAPELLLKNYSTLTHPVIQP